jgi:molybdopterin-guanine dinucleotide biosynthesis protein
MSPSESNTRIIVVGGHTRSIGKTQLVCDIIAALPEANWIAGKITQYGHGVCAQNGHDCDCAPDEHVCALEWERDANTGTDSSRFLAAGARRSFWLRTKQGFLAEGMPLLRSALDEVAADHQTRADFVGARHAVPSSSCAPIHVILESNTLLQFLKPDLFLMVLHPGKSDFKDSAQLQLDRASAFVLRDPIPSNSNKQNVAVSWRNIPLQVLRSKPNFLQREADPLPVSLLELVRASACNGPKTPSINL